LPDAKEVPIQNVNGTVLAKVLEYVNRHGDTELKDGEEKAKYSEDELKAWDVEYVKVEQAMLFEIILVSRLLPFIVGREDVCASPSGRPYGIRTLQRQVSGLTRPISTSSYEQ
jgi:hypothetical protein